MQSRIFYATCFGFVLGVLVRSFPAVGGPPPKAVVFYIVLLLCIIAFGLFIFFTLISKLKWGVIVSIFIIAFSLGILRFQIADRPAPEIFESQVGQKISFTGEIVDEPDIRENNQKLTIETSISNTSTKILVSVGLGENLKYGDEIKFSGKLEKPENFLTDQGKEFDYINYLRKDGILYLINYGSVDVVSRGNGSPIKSFLFSIKEKFLEKMNFAINTPENLLMGGLILGEKSQFDQALRQSFVDTGTIHIGHYGHSSACS